MIPDRDVWQAAVLLVKRYGDDAMLAVAERGLILLALVIIDHQGKQALDAAAYFIGHGLKQVRCLRGGLDAWSREVDPKLPRYRLG